MLRRIFSLPFEHYCPSAYRGCRTIYSSAVCRLREIHVKTENTTTIVEGVPVVSDRCSKVIQDETGRDVCPLCPKKLSVPVKYTDVLILSQFLRSDGCVLPRSVTGLCSHAQKNLQRLVHQAQRAGLMPELRPDLCDNEERTRLKSSYKWRKYNVYYVE